MAGDTCTNDGSFYTRSSESDRHRASYSAALIRPRGLFTALLALALLISLSAVELNQAEAASAEHGEQVDRLYYVFFTRQPDPGGRSHWIHHLESGGSIDNVAKHFTESAEFASRYGVPDNHAYARLVYNNVLHREPDPPGLQYWVNQLNKGLSRGKLMTLFSESPEFTMKWERDLRSSFGFDAAPIRGSLPISPDRATPNNNTSSTSPSSTTVPPPTTSSSVPVPPPPATPTPPAAPITSLPPNSILVASNGNDNGNGSASQPVRSIARAIQLAPNNGNVVLRAGSYHESITIPSNKKLTISAYRGEAGQVWLDGSVIISSWTKSGNHWISSNWTTKFDSSPTFTRGANDGNTANWTFINPSFPMAAHPDQVWVNGRALQQVATKNQVTSGKFFHDEKNNQIVIGTNPAGAEVRVGKLQQAIRIASNGSTVRDIGVRRFSPSVPDMGAVIIDHVSNVTLENMVVTDSATIGVGVYGPNAVLRNVTVTNSGMLGLMGTKSDNLLIEGVKVNNNNTEHFNSSPVAGGAKFGRLRGITVRNSTFENNDGTGLWLDESVYNAKVLSSRFRNNAGHGISLEISHQAIVLNNLVLDNRRFGLKVNNTAAVRVWNNTFSGNGRSINLVQDDRRPNTDPGFDNRQPAVPMTWMNGPAEFANNVMANQHSTGGSGGNCLLCVEDYSAKHPKRSAEEMQVTTRSNVYHRPNASTPNWIVVWSRGAGNPSVFTTLAPFQALGQEPNAQLVVGTSVVNESGAPTSAMPNAQHATALPSDLAGLIGQSTNAKGFGAWLR